MNEAGKNVLNRKGSILLEALLSTVILSVSITIIIQSMTASLRAAKYSSDYTAALLLMDNKMSSLMSGGSIESGMREEKNFNEHDQRYGYLLTTKNFDDNEHEYLNEIDVQVFWKSGRKKNRIFFKTYLLASESQSENN